MIDNFTRVTGCDLERGYFFQLLDKVIGHIVKRFLSFWSKLNFSLVKIPFEEVKLFSKVFLLVFGEMVVYVFLKLEKYSTRSRKVILN